MLEAGGLATLVASLELERSSCGRSSALNWPGTCSPGALLPALPPPGARDQPPGARRDPVYAMACCGAGVSAPGSSRAFLPESGGWDSAAGEVLDGRWPPTCPRQAWKGRSRTPALAWRDARLPRYLGVAGPSPRSGLMALLCGSGQGHHLCVCHSRLDRNLLGPSLPSAPSS